MGGARTSICFIALYAMQTGLRVSGPIYGYGSSFSFPRVSGPSPKLVVFFAAAAAEARPVVTVLSVVVVVAVAPAAASNVVAVH